MVCGYIHSGSEPPEQCPVCKAPKTKFVEIDDNGNVIEPISTSTEKKQVGQTQTSPPPTGVQDKFAGFVLRHHLHPILVHTPNGVIPIVVAFLLLGIVVHIQILEMSAFYNLLFVLLVMPAVMITGYIEWKRRYNKAKTFLFLTKFVCSLVVFSSVLILAVWRFFNPEVASPSSPTKWIYFLLGLIMLIATGIAGHIGGKLVFGSRKE